MDARWIQDPFAEADFRLYEDERPTKWVLNIPADGETPKIEESVFQYPSSIDVKNRGRFLISLWRKNQEDGIESVPTSESIPVIRHPESETQIGTIAEPEGTYDLLDTKGRKILVRNRRREERGYSLWSVVIFAGIAALIGSMLGSLIWNQIDLYLSASSDANIQVEAISTVLDSSFIVSGIRTVQ